MIPVNPSPIRGLGWAGVLPRGEVNQNTVSKLQLNSGYRRPKQVQTTTRGINKTNYRNKRQTGMHPRRQRDEWRLGRQRDWPQLKEIASATSSGLCVSDLSQVWALGLAKLWKIFKPVVSCRLGFLCSSTCATGRHRKHSFFRSPATLTLLWKGRSKAFHMAIISGHLITKAHHT